MNEGIALSGTSLRERTAEEIRVLLARRNISAAELARRTGLKQPYVSRRMTGDVAWDIDDLERIARALNVEVADLLPRVNEGRVLPTGGQPRAERGDGITIRKFGLAERPRPDGHPKRTQPHPSTRRPGRILAAHATT